MTRTGKQLRADVLEVLSPNGVQTSAKFCAAVPLIASLDDKILSLRLALNQTQSLRKQLCESISDYADTHAKALDEPLKQVKDDIEAGFVTIDGRRYRYTRSWDGLVRIDGDNMTQSFLKGLPTSWTRQKVELDTTYIGRYVTDDNDLLKQGLAWRRRREWGVAD